MAVGARALRIVLAWVAALVCATGIANAATLRVGRNERCSTIASAVSIAQPGDTVRVAAGTYPEHGIVIDRAIVLTGEGRPVIDAANQGEIITVTANGAVIRGFLLRNVGTSYVEDRAAIRLKQVQGATIEDNRFDNAFFGIYAEHSAGAMIRRNHLRGPGGREAATGNGIHLWYCKDARIEDNEVSGHRDGIYFEFVENSTIRRNLSTSNIRYGLHFMFSHGNEYTGNRFVKNGAGVAVMYTDRVKMHGNVFEHNWGIASYGLLLKDIRDSEITGNRFLGNTVAIYAEGCSRIDVRGNDFTENGYAVRIMGNSMDNTFVDNDFIGNAFDVVTNSQRSHNTFDSNYWSEYSGYDLDGDGMGDVPHHPVRLFALLVEKAPPGIVLLGSLFVKIIDTAERVMPVFTPEALVDRSPHMAPHASNDRSSSTGAGSR
jgi:nitrous oxidase accessory protein